MPARFRRRRPADARALVIPIVAGLAAASSFSLSTLVAARASRMVGAPLTVAGAMLVGLVIVLPVCLFVTPLPATSSDLLLPTLAGGANVAGLLLAYTAYRIGTVGVVSTVASTEGSIAAVIAVLAGQRLAPGSGPILAVIAVGVLLAATGGGHEIEEGVHIERRRSLQAAGLAAISALTFGFALFWIGSVSGDVPTAWILLPGRLLGCLVVGIPLLVAGRARVPRRALPYIVVCGIVEVTGFTAFTIGAQENIAVTSVLASMFAPIAAVAAFVFFGERLARRQVGGIALVVSGITLLGAAGASTITG
ncbi:MAG: EamA family transporter [Candidatus Limnocylindrales bacterium]